MIGCSGFYYPEWKELFYPKELAKSRWFSFYCERFNTLEINGSFYRYPRVETLRKWYKESPSGFTFSIKVPRFITHYWKFRNLGHRLVDFYKVAKDGLRGKLGCVLFQLHPATTYSSEMLDQILSSLDMDFNNVIEFRHSSWWRSEVIEALRDRQATFCSISHPNLPDNVIKTTDVCYYRFHGVPVLYSSKYGHTRLSRIYEQMAGFHEVFVYFNNTANGAAISDSKTFIRLTEKTNRRLKATEA